MSKHTPGPWKLDSPRIIVSGSETLAQTYYMYGDKGQTEPQAEANARLIAAAPELLSSIKALVAESIEFVWMADRQFYGNTNIAVMRDKIERAMLVIAKAEGA